MVVCLRPEYMECGTPVPLLECGDLSPLWFLEKRCWSTALQKEDQSGGRAPQSKVVLLRSDRTVVSFFYLGVSRAVFGEKRPGAAPGPRGIFFENPTGWSLGVPTGFSGKIPWGGFSPLKGLLQERFYGGEPYSPIVCRSGFSRDLFVPWGGFCCDGIPSSSGRKAVPGHRSPKGPGCRLQGSLRYPEKATDPFLDFLHRFGKRGKLLQPPGDR